MNHAELARMAEVIDWLRSPAGEHWSETRIMAARITAFGDVYPSCVQHSYTEFSPLRMAGMFSVKTDQR